MMKPPLPGRLGPARYAYLGPAGTFTEVALRQIAPPENSVFAPQVDVVSAIEAVRTDEADFAVVAIENSVEGGVTAVLDTLAAGQPLVIFAERLIPVAFALGAPSGTRLEQVRRIAAHPHAWAQCRGWVRANLPLARHVPATSNTAPAAQFAEWRRAGAAPDGPTGGGTESGLPAAPVPSVGRAVATNPAADGGGQDLPFDAALVPPAAVAHYGLVALAQEIADNPNAVTRFVLIGRPGTVPAPTGADKTTLVVHLPTDRAGALLEMLEQFATRGINLTRIESRPIGDELGRYSFSIDAEGHIAEERLAEALAGLHRFSPHVQYLGSYPRADAAAAEVGDGNLDQDYRAAQAWIAAVRAGYTV